jgi:Zn-dependent protease with chaperone function
MNAQPAGRAAVSLRNPFEIPVYVVLVILNVLIIAAALRFLIYVDWLPKQLKTAEIEAVARTILVALLLLIPGLILIRETQRAAIRGTAVQLSRVQFPDIYATMSNYARILRLRRTPDVFLANGNGTLNAFAAQAFGHDYVVLANELFANLRRESQAGLSFILGHELGHIKLHHVSLWYQLSIAYSGLIPVVGSWLSRLREYSCDRHGAYLCPDGQVGLVLLTSGRYTEQQVDVPQLLEQGRHLRGFWVELAQLPRSHPWTVRRLEQLYKLSLFA